MTYAFISAQPITFIAQPGPTFAFRAAPFSFWEIYALQLFPLKRALVIGLLSSSAWVPLVVRAISSSIYSICQWDLQFTPSHKLPVWSFKIFDCTISFSWIWQNKSDYRIGFSSRNFLSGEILLGMAHFLLPLLPRSYILRRFELITSFSAMIFLATFSVPTRLGLDILPIFSNFPLSVDCALYILIFSASMTCSTCQFWLGKAAQ